MPMWCDHCNKPLPLGLNYCISCGGPVREANFEEFVKWMKERPPRPPQVPLDPDTITDIIIENCFHLKKSKGLPVLYSYSERTLHYLTRIGYEVSEEKDHVLYMKEGE